MKLSQLVKPEIDYLRDNLNLTDEESKVFELLVKDKTYIQISLALGYSEKTTYRRIKGIKDKIRRLENA